MGVSLVDKTLAIIGFGKVRWRYASNAAPGSAMLPTAASQHPATVAKRRDRSSQHTASLQVGSEVARRARGLGLTVIAYDPYASEEKARAQVAGRQCVTAAATSELKSWQWPCSAVPEPQVHATHRLAISRGCWHCRA